MVKAVEQGGQHRQDIGHGQRPNAPATPLMKKIGRQTKTTMKLA